MMRVVGSDHGRHRGLLVLDEPFDRVLSAVPAHVVDLGEGRLLRPTATTATMDRLDAE
jgi:hypothetical protein